MRGAKRWRSSLLTRGFLGTVLATGLATALPAAQDGPGTVEAHRTAARSIFRTVTELGL